MLIPEQDKIAALIPTANPSNLGDEFEQAVLIRSGITNDFALKFAELPLRQLRAYASWAEIGWKLFSAPRLPGKKLSDDEILQLFGIELSLHELCYCCERLQEFDFGVLLLAEAFDLSVIDADLLGERSNGLENGHHGWLQRFRDIGGNFFSEVICGAGWQAIAKALDDSADMIDQQGAGANQGIPGADHGQVGLRLG